MQCNSTASIGARVVDSVRNPLVGNQTPNYYQTPNWNKNTFGRPEHLAACAIQHTTSMKGDQLKGLQVK